MGPALSNFFFLLLAKSVQSLSHDAADKALALSASNLQRKTGEMMIEVNGAGPSNLADTADDQVPEARGENITQDFLGDDKKDKQMMPKTKTSNLAHSVDDQIPEARGENITEDSFADGAKDKRQAPSPFTSLWDSGEEEPEDEDDDEADDKDNPSSLLESGEEIDEDEEDGEEGRRGKEEEEEDEEAEREEEESGDKGDDGPEDEDDNEEEDEAEKEDDGEDEGDAHDKESASLAEEDGEEGEEAEDEDEDERQKTPSWARRSKKHEAEDEDEAEDGNDENESESLAEGADEDEDEAEDGNEETETESLAGATDQDESEDEEDEEDEEKSQSKKDEAEDEDESEENDKEDENDENEPVSLIETADEDDAEEEGDSEDDETDAKQEGESEDDSSGTEEEDNDSPEDSEDDDENEDGTPSFVETDREDDEHFLLDDHAKEDAPGILSRAHKVEALKAKVKAESQKVENARIQQSQANSMSTIMSQGNSMTQAARLQEMAQLIEGNKGTEMIKSLSAEAKEALAGLQKMWLDVTANTMEKFATIQEALPKGVEAIDPEKENLVKKLFMPIEGVVQPFMDHLQAMLTSFPELNPWTQKVQGFFSFFQKDSLEQMYGSNLPGYRTYKKEFAGFKKEHQEKILDFMEMFQMDDILTVLQSPEF